MNDIVPETPGNRLKRLGMRSWRRGTKEMDLILGPWSDRNLAGLGTEDLDLYEALLAENDQDLYQWMTGQATAPDALRPIIRRISGEFGTL